jgi:Tfp pilus assembly protein PilV
LFEPQPKHLHLLNISSFVWQQGQRGAAVTIEDWKLAVEEAQCMVKREERKASAQRALYQRRLATLQIESDTLRVSVKEAEAQVTAMELSNKKVRVVASNPNPNLKPSPNPNPT